MGDDGWRGMPSRMSDETVAAAAKRLGELAHVQRRGFAVALHGGEPLLLGHVRLESLISTLRDALPAECAFGIQTNGILITDAVLDLCIRTRTTLSVSIDGPRHVHDRNRVGHNGRGTFDEVVRGIERLRAHPESEFLFSGLLAVVDSTSNPSEVYDFFKNFEPPSVDFLYRDGNNSRLPVGKSSLQSTEYGDWFVRLLGIYLADPQPIPIRFLDDLIKLSLGGAGTKDGAGLTDFGVLIIDTDGSVTKNDTLKSSFNGADRFARGWSVHTHDLTEVLSSPEYAEYHQAQQPGSAVCRACPELRVCGGGMALHRWRDDNGYDNPSVYCADQRLLIGHIRHHLTAALACP